MRRIAAYCDGDLGGELDFVRQIWCREQRQALSMDTDPKCAQGESGKQNLTHQMLWVCDSRFCWGKVGVKRLTGIAQK